MEEDVIWCLREGEVENSR